MNPVRFVIALLLIGSGVAAGRAIGGPPEQASAGAARESTQVPEATFPKDVYAETGNRLPAIKREDLDENGKKLFDLRGAGDAFGPGPLRLYSQPVADDMFRVNDFLRHKSGLDPRLVELAILVTARESNSEYEWTAHEPQGLKAGLQPATIDIVRYRKPTSALAEKDAAIIDLGREVLRTHHVSSATYARAESLFGKPGLVNFVALIGDYAATAILLNAFDQHIRPADKALLPIP